MREVLGGGVPRRTISLKGAAELDPFPRGQAFAFEAQRPAIAARGLAEAENELGGVPATRGNRVVVAFPHRGEALRTENLLRRVEARLARARRATLPDEPELLFAVSPARRGFVWRELGLVLLPDTQVFRKRASARRPRGSAARSSRSPTCAPATSSSTRTTGSASCSASRRRPSPSVTRDYLFLALPRRRPALRPARADRQGLALHRRRRARRPRSRSSAARRGRPLKTRARERGARARGRPARALRAAPAGAGHRRTTSPTEWLERLEAEFPYRETDDQRTRDRGRQGGPRGAAPDGPARLRRRRLRQDRGRRARRLRRRGQRQADADARADDGARASSTGTPSASAIATSR